MRQQLARWLLWVWGKTINDMTERKPLPADFTEKIKNLSLLYGSDQILNQSIADEIMKAAPFYEQFNRDYCSAQREALTMACKILDHKCGHGDGEFFEDEQAGSLRCKVHNFDRDHELVGRFRIWYNPNDGNQPLAQFSFTSFGCSFLHYVHFYYFLFRWIENYFETGVYYLSESLHNSP